MNQVEAPFTPRRLDVVVGPHMGSAGCPRLRALYDNAQHKRWRPELDIEWPSSIGFGRTVHPTGPLELQACRLEPFACHNDDLWTQFRWEFQSWLVCQSYHGEQAALSAAACLTAVLTSPDERAAAASQVEDEARHAQAFQMYIARYLPRPYPLTGPLKELLVLALAERDLSYMLIGMQIIVEGLADAVFRMGERTFMDDVIRSLLRRIVIDEARHVALGVSLLKQRLCDDSAAELQRREDFILSMAHLISKRFLMQDLWERLEVESRSAKHFVEHAQLMIDFRRVAFYRVASVLDRIGLLTPTVACGLVGMGLLRKEFRRSS